MREFEEGLVGCFLFKVGPSGPESRADNMFKWILTYLCLSFLKMFILTNLFNNEIDVLRNETQQLILILKNLQNIN